MKTVPDSVKATIRDEIMSETQQEFESAGFTSKGIAEELARIAFSDMKDFVRVDDEGRIYAKRLDKLKNGLSRAVRKIKEKRKVLRDDDGEEVLDITYEFELHDKLQALETGAEMAGKRPSGKLDVQHSGEVVVMKPEQIRKPKNSGLSHGRKR